VKSGNRPSLPQTKCCALCPAKFTRTTHLNRHLRSHTNERAHRCSSCDAEFTRSDLLTRHKRTCGDARNVNKSRRKSCQACAESKVKCNLEQPCSKCCAKGKECFFINDPRASRRQRSLGTRRSPSSAFPSEASECSLIHDNLGSSSPSSITSHLSNDVENIPHNNIPSYHPNLSNKAVFGNLSEGSCSSRSSPQLVSFDPRPDGFNNASFDTMELDSNFPDFFSHTLDPYMEDPFRFSSCQPRVQTETDVSPWEFRQACSAYGTEGLGPVPSHVNHDQSFINGSTNLTSTSFSKTFYSRPPLCCCSQVNFLNDALNSASSEFNQYCMWLLFQLRQQPRTAG